MADITKKFSDFKSKEEKKFDKTKEYKTLSDDMTVLNKLEDGSFEKIKGSVDIVQVTGIITDEEEIKKIEENFTLDTSILIKDIKRGNTLWLTALLQRTSGSSINSQTMGVVKVRVVDYFYGLSKLNTLKNNPNK